jgi:hypothetical protein
MNARVRRWAPVAVWFLAAASGCSADEPIRVEGTYLYDSKTYALRGTITFVHTGDLVRITDTTYEMADDRPLVGEGTLRGARLDALLVPKNGDTDYHADVKFQFSDAGRHFRLLGFTDSNGDFGGEDCYYGDRL